MWSKCKQRPSIAVHNKGSEAFDPRLTDITKNTTSTVQFFYSIQFIQFYLIVFPLYDKLFRVITYVSLIVPLSHTSVHKKALLLAINYLDKLAAKTTNTALIIPYYAVCCTIFFYYEAES